MVEISFLASTSIRLEPGNAGSAGGEARGADPVGLRLRANVVAVGVVRLSMMLTAAPTASALLMVRVVSALSVIVLSIGPVIVNPVTRTSERSGYGMAQPIQGDRCDRARR